MLTPGQARDLVEHFGGQRPAARAIGVASTTLRYWLDPEPHRARVDAFRVERIADPEWAERRRAQHRARERDRRATDPAWVERRRAANREWRRRKYASDPAWVHRERERVGRHYDALTGPQYNLRLLRSRRAKALQRRDLRLANRED